jgi:regulator of replication initiation timing
MYMNLVRTTLRLDKDLKKQAELLAVRENTTLQAVMNEALRERLNKTAKKRAKLLVLPKIDLGVPVDNITRDEMYGTPTW